MTITVRLDDKLEKRLNKLVEKTYRSKSFYIKEALNDYLNNREDYLLALAALEKKEPTISLDAIKKELGI